jgi:hypothetical protein
VQSSQKVAPISSYPCRRNHLKKTAKSWHHAPVKKHCRPYYSDMYAQSPVPREDSMSNHFPYAPCECIAKARSDVLLRSAIFHNQSSETNQRNGKLMRLAQFHPRGQAIYKSCNPSPANINNATKRDIPHSFPALGFKSCT